MSRPWLEICWTKDTLRSYLSHEIYCKTIENHVMFHMACLLPYSLNVQQFHSTISIISIFSSSFLPSLTWHRTFLLFYISFSRISHMFSVPLLLSLTYLFYPRSSLNFYLFWSMVSYLRLFMFLPTFASLPVFLIFIYLCTPLCLSILLIIAMQSDYISWREVTS